MKIDTSNCKAEPVRLESIAQGLPFTCPGEWGDVCVKTDERRNDCIVVLRLKTGCLLDLLPDRRVIPQPHLFVAGEEIA